MSRKSLKKPTVFISHITEETALAEIIKSHINKDFLGLMDIFVSSDKESISAGSKWLDEVGIGLKNAKIEIILCSHASVERPWINFEAGAGWVKEIPVIPVCHTGMRKVELPIPLNMLQAVDLKNKDDIERVYKVLSKVLGGETPNTNFEELVKEVEAFEAEYGVLRNVRNAIFALIRLKSDIKTIFESNSKSRSISGPLPDILIDKMTPHLESLRSLGMIDFHIGGTVMQFSNGPGGGSCHGITIEVTDTYLELANKVMS